MPGTAVVEAHPPAPPEPTVSSIPPPPSPGSGPKRRRVLPLLLVAALVGGVAGGVAGWLAGSRTETANQAPSASVPGTEVPNSGDPIQSLPSLVATIEASVVDIEAVVETTGPFGRTSTADVAGSGFVYAADGLIATNAHVVNDAESITITFTDGRSYDADIVGIDTTDDLALLRIDATDLAALPLATDLDLAVGDFVIVIGNALDLEGGPSVSIGVISALDRDIEVTDGSTLTGLIQTDAAISSGDSGGPLLTASGAVIGINTAAASSTTTANVQNIGFAIPITNAAPILEQLAATSR